MPLAGGCATVMRGVHEPLHIESDPAGATARLSTGDSCITPCDVVLARKVPVQVRVAKAGFDTETVSVRSVGTGAGAAGLLRNAVLGGIVGASVDLSSGAMNSLVPNPVKVRLRLSIKPLPPLELPEFTLTAPAPADQPISR